MKKRQLSKEELIEQLKELSNSKTLVTERYAPNQKNSTLLSYKRGADGRVYGIIKENSKYFIKVASGKKSELTSFDFAYIGGLGNILQERYDSYSDATKRLNFKLISLNEAYGRTDENDIPLNKDIDKEKEETVDTTSDVDVTASMGDEETVEDTSMEVSADETESTDDSSIETSGEEEIEVSSEESSDDDGDVTKEIQSLLGKLTQKFNEIGDVDSQMAKTAINTVISATKSGIEKMGDDDKEKIVKRIEKDGEKIDEQKVTINEQKLNKIVNKLIKEEKLKLMFEEMENEIDSMSEEDLISEIGEEHLDELYEDSWINEMTQKLCEIEEKSHKLAKNFIKEKYGKQCNELMTEDYDVLDEASIKDLFSKVGLTKAYDKAKSFFTKKNVENFVDSNPQVKANVEDGIEALQSNDKNKWLSFKQKVGRGLAMYLLIFKLMSIASPLMAADENNLKQADIIDATKKIEMVAKGGGEDLSGGDPGDGEEGEVSLKPDKTSGESLRGVLTSDELEKYKVKGTGPHTVEIEFSGGEVDSETIESQGKVFKTPPVVQKYTNIDINDKNVAPDSKELGKKYKWVSEKMSQFDSDPEKFNQQFEDLKGEFKERFADTELRMMGDKVVFDHKFVDNNNIAQAKYKTDKGDIIEKGAKIPQGTKVVDFFAGDVDTETDTKSTTKYSEPYQKSYTQLTVKPTTISKASLSSKITERGAIAKGLIQDLNDMGVKVHITGENIVVDPNSNLWVETDKVDDSLDNINDQFEKIGQKYGVNLKNMFRNASDVDRGGPKDGGSKG